LFSKSALISKVIFKKSRSEHPFYVATPRKKSVSTNSSTKPKASPLPGSNESFTAPAMDGKVMP